MGVTSCHLMSLFAYFVPKRNIVAEILPPTLIGDTMIHFAFLNLDTSYTYDFRCAICLCVEMCKPSVHTLLFIKYYYCLIVHPTPIYRARKKHAKCQLTGTHVGNVWTISRVKNLSNSLCIGL